MEELAAGFIDSLVGMGPEEIALCLQQVSGKAFAAVAVIERERGGEGRGRHAEFNRLDSAAPPAALVLIQVRAEEIVEEEIGKIGVLVESLFDVAEECAADDAAAAPA
jgi:hypothetical protein